MKFLNLGCGSRYVINKGWTNVDFHQSEDVIRHDLRTPLPFNDAAFDVVYHSHVLEHFSRPGAKIFLAECLRVLKPGGLLRVAVPDLEGIVRAYLTELQQSRSGNVENAANHEWMIYELFDQMVRNQPGGNMAQLLESPNFLNESFVIARLGAETKKIIQQSKMKRSSMTFSPSQALHVRLKLAIRSVASMPLSERIARVLLGPKAALLDSALFRESGEVHQWMYDDFSLTRILSSIGFIDIQRKSATESAIPSWMNFNLDTEPDGTTYKPDSLYLEANRPS